MKQQRLSRQTGPSRPRPSVLVFGLLCVDPPIVGAGAGGGVIKDTCVLSLGEVPRTFHVTLLFPSQWVELSSRDHDQ